MKGGPALEKQGGRKHGDHSHFRTNVFISIRFWMKVLWLFTESDVPTFVVPSTAFGVLGALSGPLLTSNATPSWKTVLSRTPLIVCYVWTNTLVFDLANQRLEDSVLEDQCNKPWRPIPTGMISRKNSRRLLLACLPVFLAVSCSLGVWKETSLLFTLNWMYNDLRAGDEDFVIRNTVIGVAYALYNEGALRVACGKGYFPNDAAFIWTAIISGVIFTTMHVQDLKDQEGDSVRGRRSAPIVLGDWAARWTIAVPIVLWSLVIPLYWDIPTLTWTLPIGIGSVIANRVLWFKQPRDDKVTWTIWAGWLAVLYLLPVIKGLSMVDPRV